MEDMGRLLVTRSLLLQIGTEGILRVNILFSQENSEGAPDNPSDKQND